MSEPTITFIVPVNKEDVLSSNILSSKVYKDGKHQFIFQRGYSNVALAYNEAIPRAVGDVLIFSHQDVFYPDEWEDALFLSLREMEALDSNWGVLGSAGVIRTKRFFGRQNSARYIGDYSSNLLGGDMVIDYRWPRQFPCEVDTLDELILITRKENAVFDESIPNNHFYGADLCLQCKKKGMKSYAISAYVHHNSTTRWVQSDFYEAATVLYKKYPEELPIATTCIVIEDDHGAPKFRTDLLAMVQLTTRAFFKMPKRATKRNRPGWVESKK